MPADWGVGVNFTARRLLRIAVAFYGLNISIQQIAAVGLPGLAVSVAVVLGTLLIGTVVGQRMLGLDRDTAMLTAAGSAICGAAAVLAFEPTLRAAPHKSAVAVATVVLFGTLSMFLYPILYHAGWLDFDTQALGIYIGGTIHEVAQVVGAASNIDPATTEVATIVKMTRVALLVPVLLVLGMYLRSAASQAGGQAKGRQAADSLVRGRLPGAGHHQLAKHHPPRCHRRRPPPGRLRPDHGHDGARHRNPLRPDQESRPPRDGAGSDPVRLAVGWRLRYREVGDLIAGPPRQSAAAALAAHAAVSFFLHNRLVPCFGVGRMTSSTKPRLRLCLPIATRYCASCRCPLTRISTGTSSRLDHGSGRHRRVDPRRAPRAGRVATVAVNAFQFKEPVFVGDLLSFYASIAKTGTTSVTVSVEVYAERQRLDAEVVKVTEATLTYVATDEARRSRPLPTL